MSSCQMQKYLSIATGITGPHHVVIDSHSLHAVLTPQRAACEHTQNADHGIIWGQPRSHLLSANMEQKIHNGCASFCKKLDFFLPENGFVVNKVLTWLRLNLHIRKEQNILGFLLGEGQESQGMGQSQCFLRSCF